MTLSELQNIIKRGFKIAFQFYFRNHLSTDPKPSRVDIACHIPSAEWMDYARS